jgi:hypothetical protein
MNKLLRLALPSLILSLVACGCRIENHHDSVEPSDTGDTCGSYCLHLYECASIAESQIASCLDQCDVKMHADSDRTATACECVLGDECRALSDYDCPGAPVPSTGSGDGAGGTAATSNGGAASSAGGAASSRGANGGAASTAGAASGGAPVDCHGGYDCADSEDCVDGACRQRCTASCQCPTDLSCIDHYCRTATPPPACSTDCECASGQHCISGSCG